MKNFMILFFLVVTKCLSQSSSDRQIIDSILVVSNFPTVVCKESTGYKYLEEKISNVNLYNKYFPENNIELTKAEIAFIKNEIKKNINYIFPQELFPNELMISKDTLQSYSSNKVKMWYKESKTIYESQDSLKILQFRNEKPYPSVLTFVNFFSKPIYFRSNTLCIIYSASLCNFHNGMGGCWEAFLFRNENGIWKKFIRLPGGCY